MRFFVAVTIPLLAAACGGGKKPVVVDQPPAAMCGNGVTETGETCDDGNTADGDGCSATCQTEVAVCPLMPDLGSLTLIMGAGADNMAGTIDDVPFPANSCGQGGTNPCDLFQTPMMGGNMGKETFFLLAGLPDSVSVDPNKTNFLGLEIVTNNGVLLLNQDIPLSADPTASLSSVALDQPGGAAFQALVYVLGDINTTSGMFQTLYTPSSGSVKVLSGSSQINAVVRAVVGAAPLVETDGAKVVAGGCTSNLGGLAVALTQGTATFAPDQPTHIERTELASKVYHELLRRTGRE